MSTTESATTREIPCVSLDMVILDEIRMPNRPPLLDVIGGSATFVTLGLCLFATKSHSHGPEKVVDPTGAGNAFLGGYVAGWLREGHVGQALHCGAVAASFALEQSGLPRSADVSAEAGMERLDEFRERLKI